MTFEQVKHIIQFDSSDQLREALDNRSIDFDINQYDDENSWRNIQYGPESREKWGYEQTKKGVVHYAIDRGDQDILNILSEQPNIDLNLEFFYEYQVQIDSCEIGGGAVRSEPHPDNKTVQLTPVEYAFQNNQNDMAFLLIQKGSNFSADKVKLDQLVNVFQRLSEQAGNDTRNEIKRSLAHVLTHFYSLNTSERNDTATARASSQATSAASLAQSYSQFMRGGETSVEERGDKRPRISFS